MSFILAGALLLLVNSHQANRGAQRAWQGRSGTYHAVLRDRPFLRLMAVATLIWVGVFLFEIALPPYLIITMRMPAWMVGLLFALNTGMIVVFQVPVTRAVASWRRTRAMIAGAVGYALSFLLFAAAPMLEPVRKPT